MQMFGTRGTAMVLATMFGFLLALAGAPSAQGAEMTRMQVAWSEPVDVVVEVWLKDFFGPKADSVSGANGIPQSRLDDPRALGPTTAQFVDLAPEQNRRFAYRVCYESYPATDAALHLTFTNPDGTKLSRDYPVPEGRRAVRPDRRGGDLRHAAGPRRHGESGVHEAGTRSDDVRRRVPH